jgi:hypothetical protein
MRNRLTGWAAGNEFVEFGFHRHRQWRGGFCSGKPVRFWEMVERLEAKRPFGKMKALED